MNLKLKSTAFISSLILLAITFASCSSINGTRLNTPFSSKKYMSDARYFRAVGMGTSANLNIARSKAQLESKKSLAQQVQTNLQVVSDNYSSELVGNQAAEAVEMFESLAREVTNTTIGDIRTLGEETYQLDNGSYEVYVAIEVKKKAMFRFLKTKAKSDAKISELVRAQMVMMLDAELDRLDQEDPED